MIDKDRVAFAEILAAVYTFYRQEMTDAAFEIWWTSMKLFDFAAIREALGKHAMNPDTGQFLPKPADVVKMLGGSTLDSAMIALSKLEGAMSSVGSYYTVVFDDSIIHRVVEEMGGWIQLCAIKTKDWEFRRTEFLNRYRGYRTRNERPPHLARLIGVFDGENGDRWVGHPAYKPDQNLRLIGDVKLAIAVMAGGSSTRLLTITAGEIAAKTLTAIEDKR